MAVAGPSAVRRPVAGEIICDFTDSPGTFIKSKLDEQVVATEKRRIEREQAAKAGVLQSAIGEKEINGDVTFKSEDVALIVKELGTTSAEAEDVLRQSNGNVEQALKNLISPPDVKIGWRTRA